MKKFTFSVLLLCLLAVVHGEYLCSRPETPCHASGTCNNGVCTCNGGPTQQGLDCRTDISGGTAGCSLTCENGGTCYKDPGGGADFCLCAIGFYGTTCRFKRFGLHCYNGGMVFNAFPLFPDPFGDYMGRSQVFLFGYDGGAVPCRSKPVAMVSEAPMNWAGLALDIAHANGPCGPATESFDGNIKYETRLFLISYRASHLVAGDPIIQATCSFDSDNNVIREFVSVVNDPEANFLAASVDDTFDPVVLSAQLTPFGGGSTSSLVLDGSATVNVGDKITFTAVVTGDYAAVWFMEVDVEDEDGDFGPYALLNGGCEGSDYADLRVTGANQPRNDPNALTSVYETIAFKFNGKDEIHYTVEVLVCRSGDESDCGCTARRRRRRDATSNNEDTGHYNFTFRLADSGGAQTALSNTGDCAATTQVMLPLLVLGVVTLLALTACGIMCCLLAKRRRRDSESKESLYKMSQKGSLAPSPSFSSASLRA